MTGIGCHVQQENCIRGSGVRVSRGRRKEIQLLVVRFPRLKGSERCHITFMNGGRRNAYAVHGRSREEGAASIPPSFAYIRQLHYMRPFLREGLLVNCLVTVGSLVPSRIFPTAQHLIDVHGSCPRYGRPDFSRTTTRAITTASIYRTHTHRPHTVSMPAAEDLACFEVIVLGSGSSLVVICVVDSY